MNRNRFRDTKSEYDLRMKRMAIALFELGKSIVARPAKPKQAEPGSLHWTKFDKPIDQMSEAERKAASERLTEEMLGIVKDQNN
jgi:hypothetical protein